MTEWLSFVEECKINSSAQTICKTLESVQLDDEHLIISFDVSSLYTNVSVNETIEV